MTTTVIRILASIALLLAGLATQASAVTLDDYKHRLVAAREALTVLIVDIDDTPSRPAIARVNELIPRSERIEWRSGSVETGNEWLSVELDRFGSEPEAEKRLGIITAIDERLVSMLSAVETLEQAALEGPTKDGTKQKLADILRREEYQKAPEREESLFQKWWREFTEWLAKQFPEPNIAPGTASGLGSATRVLQILVLVLALALIAFLIYRFVPAIAGRFGRRSKESRDTRVILGERIEAHESARDLLAEAERMAREGDLRGAIRKGYVAVLCELSDRKVIALARHKTNRDYLSDVRRNEQLFGRMRTLTGTFESSWYGLRPAADEEWEDFRDSCRQAVTEARG